MALKLLDAGFTFQLRQFHQRLQKYDDGEVEIVERDDGLYDVWAEDRLFGFFQVSEAVLSEAIEEFKATKIHCFSAFWTCLAAGHDFVCWDATERGKDGKPR